MGLIAHQLVNEKYVRRRVREYQRINPTAPTVVWIRCGGKMHSVEWVERGTIRTPFHKKQDLKVRHALKTLGNKERGCWAVGPSVREAIDTLATFRWPTGLFSLVASSRRVCEQRAYTRNKHDSIKRRDPKHPPPVLEMGVDVGPQRQLVSQEAFPLEVRLLWYKNQLHDLIRKPLSPEVARRMLAAMIRGKAQRRPTLPSWPASSPAPGAGRSPLVAGRPGPSAPCLPSTARAAPRRPRTPTSARPRRGSHATIGDSGSTAPSSSPGST